MENMSDIEATTTVQKVETANAATDPIPSKKSKIKFVSATNIHNLKRVEIYKYIVRLRRRIRNLVKKCHHYKKREEVLKLVFCFKPSAFFHMPPVIHVVFIISENKPAQPQRRRKFGRSWSKCRKRIIRTRR